MTADKNFQTFPIISGYFSHTRIIFSGTYLKLFSIPTFMFHTYHRDEIEISLIFMRISRCRKKEFIFIPIRSDC
jgi:hypothetical protein